MVFEHIEKLKRAFTDKYVVVDETRAELARFKDAIGLIKTVNMNGRALVEFDQYDNIGWYDIEIDFLKVVPKPEPALAEAKHEAAGKAATQKGAEKVTAPAAGAGQVAQTKAAAKPATASAKPSTADILAAARTKKGTGEPVAAKAAPAAAKPAPAAPPKAAPAAGEKLSTAAILAAARGKGAAPAAAPATKEVGRSRNRLLRKRLLNRLRKPLPPSNRLPSRRKQRQQGQNPPPPQKKSHIAVGRMRRRNVGCRNSDVGFWRRFAFSQILNLNPTSKILSGGERSR